MSRHERAPARGEIVTAWALYGVVLTLALGLL